MYRKLEYVVDEAYDGKKLKAFMRVRVKTSSSTLNKLKNDPLGLLLNGEHVRTVDIVHTGDVLTINIPEENCDIPPADFDDLDIVYEDEDILVINKPAGLAMHPTHNHQGDTLANKVAGYFASKDRNIVFRAIGRLDKCTSGLVLIALNRHSASLLSENIEKTYIAIVGGEYHGSGTIDKNIYRPDPMKTLRAADETGEKGERAVTHYKVLSTDGKRSVVEIHLETGRTHQIRVHFSSMGTPLVGDEMYGSTDDGADRALLHCAVMEFKHPITKADVRLCADLPEDMDKLIKTEKNDKNAIINKN